MHSFLIHATELHGQLRQKVLALLLIRIFDKGKQKNLIHIVSVLLNHFFPPPFAGLLLPLHEIFPFWQVSLQSNYISTECMHFSAY